MAMTQEQKVASLAEGIENIYNNAARFHWTSEFVNAMMVVGIFDNEVYKKLPHYAQQFLMGVRSVYDKQLWKKVVFSYVVNGKRLAIDSKAYQRVSPRKVHEHCVNSGAYVYRDDVTKQFTKSNDDKGKLPNHVLGN